MSLISFPAGTDFHQPFAFVDTSSVAVSLVSATNLQMVILNGRSVITTLTTTSSPSLLVVTSAAGGLVRADFDNTTTASLQGEYRYEITCTLSSGDTVVLGQGRIKIRPSYIGGS